MYTTQISLLNYRKTEQFSGILARTVGPGDCLLLTGEIGSGKTVLARALIRALYLPEILQEEIPSPTYTLIQSYHCRTFEIWHADLYRVENCWEIIELGLIDAFVSALCVVEWGDRLAHFAPRNALWLHLDNPTESSEFRTLSIKSENRDLIERLWNDWLE
ncbi:MAG: tRNA (adenosine(37)-N6)-threonylcarbamoyltransferase complex ATPase subunit type 1 TsaE [Rhodobacteraceae bacterium]|nr:tRNA (adenosine(37)-N6)-threonylcarbamoyltransferase complex ATPase subunit type 1 TsaE [Paracoccaceae bacterium]